MLEKAAMAEDFLTKAFIQFRQRLKGSSGRMLSERADAEDVLQDAFVRLWKKQYPLHSEQEAAALLGRTVRNASLNERRRKRPMALETDVAEDPPDSGEKEQLYEQMTAKIRTELTELQRYILEEKEYGGRTLEDIALELGMEPAAVRMQLSRARKTLRNALSHDR